jgi:hypothetical protein
MKSAVFSNPRGIILNNLRRIVWAKRKGSAAGFRLKIGFWNFFEA